MSGAAEAKAEAERRLADRERFVSLGRLSSSLAHEINNPIGIIRGYLRTMLPEAHDEALKDELRILDEEAAACQRITEDLLAYSRTPEITKERTQLAALLEEAVTRFCAASLDASR